MKSVWQSFKSPLAEPINKYLEHKRALCKKFKSEENTLRVFDTYLYKIALADISGLTSGLIEQYLSERPPSRPSTYNNHVGNLRRFFAWMVKHEIISKSPLQFSRPRTEENLKPYILSHEVVKQLLEMAGQLRDTSNARRRGPTYQMVFALAYGLGLRVGEISRLQVGDIDFQRAVIVINKSKFSKTRSVPMGPKLTLRLKEFLEQSGPHESTDPVFSARGDKRPLARVTITVVFHQLILKMGLKAVVGEREPRLHDLRHSFAVNTLLRWYREGKSPSEHLPYLCTFLGHSKLSSTAIYLTITADLLNEANDRFHKFAAPVLKEVAQ